MRSSMRAAEYNDSQVSLTVSAVMSETSSSGCSTRCRFLRRKAFMRRRMTFRAEIWACKDAASSSTDAAASRGGGPIMAALLGSRAGLPGAVLSMGWRTTRARDRRMSYEAPRAPGFSLGSRRCPCHSPSARRGARPPRGAVLRDAEACPGRAWGHLMAAARGLYLLASFVAPSPRREARRLRPF